MDSTGTFTDSRVAVRTTTNSGDAHPSMTAETQAWRTVHSLEERDIHRSKMLEMNIPAGHVDIDSSSSDASECDIDKSSEALRRLRDASVVVRNRGDRLLTVDVDADDD
jgi:hypothetical protein